MTYVYTSTYNGGFVEDDIDVCRVCKMEERDCKCPHPEDCDCDECVAELEYWDQYTSCRNPGRNGCQVCDACADYGDIEYHRRKENGWQ